MKIKQLHFFNKIPKQIARHNKGLCFFCHKEVKNIQSHMKIKHRVAKR